MHWRKRQPTARELRIEYISLGFRYDSTLNGNSFSVHSVAAENWIFFEQPDGCSEENNYGAIGRRLEWVIFFVLGGIPGFQKIGRCEAIHLVENFHLAIRESFLANGDSKSFMKFFFEKLVDLKWG